MQKLIYNPKTQKVVLKISDNDYRWFCSNCITTIKDDFCKVGYSITCHRCKKEYEIAEIRENA